MRGPDVVQSWMVLVVGVIFLGVAVGLHHQDRPYDNGVTTTGTVSAFTSSTDSSNRIRYERAISFTVPGNRPVTIRDVEGRGYRQPVVGEKVDISYRAGEPGEAKVVPPPSAYQAWMTPLFAALSLGLVLTGLIGVSGPALRRAAHG
jgi:hypothetical protein